MVVKVTRLGLHGPTATVVAVAIPCKHNSIIPAITRVNRVLRNTLVCELLYSRASSVGSVKSVISCEYQRNGAQRHKLVGHPGSLIRRLIVDPISVLSRTLGTFAVNTAFYG